MEGVRVGSAHKHYFETSTCCTVYGGGGNIFIESKVFLRGWGSTCLFL